MDPLSQWCNKQDSHVSDTKVVTWVTLVKPGACINIKMFSKNCFWTQKENGGTLPGVPCSVDCSKVSFEVKLFFLGHPFFMSDRAFGAPKDIFGKVNAMLDNLAS